MRIVIWNMGNGFASSKPKHERAWEYLRTRKEEVDVALLQETFDPRPWADEHWASVVWRPKYDVARSRKRRWGSAIIARSLELEPYEPDDRFPWLKELRGSVAVARTTTEPVWLASVHASANWVPDDIMKLHPWNEVPVSFPGIKPSEPDLIPYELRQLFGDQTFIWGGDLNSAVSMDDNPRFIPGNRRLREIWRETGSFDLRLRFHDEEQRTFFRANNRPYQLDHVFADAATERRVEGWDVDTRPVAADPPLSDHAPNIVALAPGMAGSSFTASVPPASS